MVKAKKPKSSKQDQDSVSQLVSSGFTLSENYIIDQMDNTNKKKKKEKGKPVEDTTTSKKIGSMFKVKKESNVELESGGEEVDKQEKDEENVPGFDAPKKAKVKTPTKRKSDGGGGPNAKMEKPDWKEIKEKQKGLKEDRKKKASGTRYDLSVKAKKIWEELRREDCPKERQLALSIELFKLTKGHAKQV
jgi:hypothetical protein